MFSRVLDLGGRRALKGGIAARAARRLGGPFGGILPIAAYFAWKHRDDIRNAVAEWRGARSQSRVSAAQ
jgi:hypothetical protein